MGKRRRRKKSWLRPQHSDYAETHNTVGVTMSHAALETMLHAAGPLGGVWDLGTRLRLTESSPLPRNLVKKGWTLAGLFYRRAISLFVTAALKQQLTIKQAQALRHPWTWLKEKSSWEEECPLRDSDALENWDKNLFLFFFFLIMTMNGAGNDGPLSSNQSLTSITLEQL